MVGLSMDYGGIIYGLSMVHILAVCLWLLAFSF
jgi:hypothetical protein